MPCRAAHDGLHLSLLQPPGPQQCGQVEVKKHSSQVETHTVDLVELDQGLNGQLTDARIGVPLCLPLHLLPTGSGEVGMDHLWVVNKS